MNLSSISMQSNQNSISLPQLGAGAQVLPSLPANYPASDTSQSSGMTPTGSGTVGTSTGAILSGLGSDANNVNAGLVQLSARGGLNVDRNPNINNINSNASLMPLGQHMYGHQAAHTLPLPQLTYQNTPNSGHAQAMSISYLAQPGSVPMQQQASLTGADPRQPIENEHVDSNGMLIGKSGKPLRNTKRAAQNRNAQKAFRQRRERYIKDLEIKAKEFDHLDAQLAEVQQENESLKRYVIELEQRLGMSGAGANAGAAPTAHRASGSGATEPSM